MRLRLLGYGALIVIGISAFAAPVWSAQQRTPAPPKSAPQQANTLPTVISVIDVIPNSEGALAQLRDIRTELETDKNVNSIETEIPRFSDQLNQWWKGEADSIQKLRSMQRMNDILWQLRLYESQISAWNTRLSESSKKWNSQTEVVNNLIANWKA